MYLSSFIYLLISFLVLVLFSERDRLQRGVIIRDMILYVVCSWFTILIGVASTLKQKWIDRYVNQEITTGTTICTQKIERSLLSPTNYKIHKVPTWGGFINDSVIDSGPVWTDSWIFTITFLWFWFFFRMHFCLIYACSYGFFPLWYLSLINIILLWGTNNRCRSLNIFEIHRITYYAHSLYFAVWNCRIVRKQRRPWKAWISQW